jgi:hypothetical protein
MKPFIISALLLAATGAAYSTSVGRVVEVSAKDARAHNLPALTFGFQYDGDVEVESFPAPDIYVRLISRRTGIWGFAVYAYHGANTPETARGVLKQHGYTPGPTCKLELAGLDRQAAGGFSAESSARQPGARADSHDPSREEACVILLPHSDHDGAAVLFDRGAGGHQLANPVEMRKRFFGLELDTFSMR